ncbi:BTAD domain-containing putative transcriptional regulator [Actinokineospora globicatena]|uniref:SARP family transcriptional regulator n=1 Tax=Actinokineospora globicatena TaxID=103729 RepID=A0A9W6QRJ5_9PSEU|nr:BTAD domain-containing putative transcriptional regulator [Actinokineospora globicatena]GLW95581.1 SARP family transcriptional regulator [Actinokineospora globicatena]
MLGPLRLVGEDGAVVGLGGARLRMLVARLALDAGRVVSVAELVAGLWGDEPPADATNALQSLVSRLRRGLRAGADGLVESHPAGYRLAVAAEQVDVHQFERLVASGRAAAREGRYAEATRVLADAEGLWTGPALAGLEDAPFAGNVVARLGELRVGAREDRIDAEIRDGRHTEVIAELSTLVAEHPLRERPAALLVKALFLSGRQAEALAAYEQARRVLAEELGVEPSQELRELHVSVLRGEIAPAPVKAVTAALTSFVGRRTELTEVTRLLDSTRLVTLVGPGGAGKTRLSREVVAGLDGMSWFVELAGVRAADDVTAAALAALGIRESRLIETHPAPRPGTALDRLVEVLGSQRSVLVLDNCEHLIEAAAALADGLLARCPRLRVLATSREPLAITGESAYPLGPLGLPAESARPDEVTEAEAVRLFADRAESASPGFRVDDSNAAVVAEICRGLDGLPLALELAAARLRSMTVGQIAERLHDRFRLLTGGSRTSLPRHRTLRAVVEWSWDLLEKPERVLAARMSVFPVAALDESITAVAADDDLLPVDDVLYVLASLVEKSIVVAAEGRDGQVRYRMLETVRAYAAERLTELGETEQVRQAFCRYFLAYLQEAEPRLRGPEQVWWLARVTADHENLLAGLRYAIAVGDADLAHRMAVSAGWFWMIGGHHREALNLVVEVAAIPGDAPPHARATLRSMAAFVESGGLVDKDLLRTLRADLVATDAISHYPIMAMLEPMLAAFAGDAEDAIAGLDRGANHPDPWARALSLLAAAFLHDNQGYLAEAEEAGERALAAFRALGDRWGQAIAIGQVSDRRSLRGDHAGAIAANEESVRLVTELGSVDEMPGVLGKLGVQRARAGDLAGAEADLRRALDLAKSSSTQENQALLYGWLASIACQRDDLPAAKSLIAQCKATLTTIDNHTPHWFSLYSSITAQIALAENDPTAAMTHLATAVSLMNDIGDMPLIGSLAEVTAQALLAAGDAAGAARLLALAEVIRGAPDLGNPVVVKLRGDLTAALGAEGHAAGHAAGMGFDRAAALVELNRVLGIGDLDG